MAHAPLWNLPRGGGNPFPPDHNKNDKDPRPRKETSTAKSFSSGHSNNNSSSGTSSSSSSSSSSKKKKRTATRTKRSTTSTTPSEETGSLAEHEETESSSSFAPSQGPDKEDEVPTAEADAREASSKSSSSPPHPIIAQILQDDDYYKILGVSKHDVRLAENHHRSSSGSLPSSSPPSVDALLKKAYRRRCVLTHPDKTAGDRRAFDKVAEAYHVLSNVQLRHVYNRLGKAGVQAHQQHRGSGAGAGAGGATRFTTATSPEELFRTFFGASGSGGSPSFFHAQQQQQQQRRRRQPRRNRNVRYQLEVSLEDLYRGMTRTVQVSSPTSSSSAFLSRSSPSSTLTKRVEVHIPRGARHGQAIRLSGEMDFDPTDVPGDLIFVIQQAAHPVFTRAGCDLALKLDISLSEAIHGVTRTISHLDGRQLVLASARQGRLPHRPSTTSSSSTTTTTTTEEESLASLPIQTDDVQVLRGHGMPKDDTGTSFGDLYVQFKVNLPDTSHATDRLTPAERQELSRLLNKLEGRKTPDQYGWDPKQSVLHLQKASLREFGRASGQPRAQRDSSEHMMMEEEEDDDDDDEEEQAFRQGVFGQEGFFFGTHPFFGGGMHPFSSSSSAMEEDDVQCRQM